MAPPSESVALICRVAIAAPETLDWLPGLVTLTVLVRVSFWTAEVWPLAATVIPGEPAVLSP